MVMITNSFDKFPNEPTGLMYEQFGKIGVNPATTPAYETTFANSTGWTLTNTSGTTWNVSSPKLNWRADIARSGSGAIYDLGSLDSYSSWVLRFELTVDDSFGRNADTLAMFGIHDKSDLTTSINGGYSSSHAQVQIQCAFMDLQNNHRKFQAKIANSSSVGQDTSGFNNTLTRDVKYYIEIKKNSATSYTVGYSTNSDYTTGQVSSTETITLSGLRYLHFEAWTQNATASYESWGVGWVENLKLYTGVTSPSPASLKVKQHFIEWFSGKQIPSYWNKRTIAGSGTWNMEDGVDKGLKVQFTSGRGCIDFGAIRPFSKTGSRFIAVANMNSTGNQYWLLGMKYGETSYSPDGYYFNYMSSGSTFTFASYGGGSSSTATATSVSTSPAGTFHVWDGEVTPSNMLGKVDGTLEATRTANMPQNNMHPFFFTQRDQVNGDGNIRYMECYNT